MSSADVENDLDIIGTDRVAELLDIDRSVVIRRVNAGKIPAVTKLPGKTGAHLFSRAAIDALLTVPTAEGKALSQPSPHRGGDSN